MLHMPKLNHAPLANIRPLTPSFSMPHLGKQGKIIFRIRERQINADVTPVSQGLFASLGINPQHFRAGLKIYSLDSYNYRRFCDACEITANGGFYPLARNGDMENVLAGKEDYLPEISRVAVLPENATRTPLTHEILHDVFVGGGIPKSKRDEFSSLLFAWAGRALRDPRRKREAHFYETVGQLCAQKMDISINSTALTKILREGLSARELMIFAGECFVYAGEMFLGLPQERDFGVLPFEINYYFRGLKLGNSLSNSSGQSHRLESLQA